jgi:tetratricopeptide (TPR) repeat protein
MNREQIAAAAAVLVMALLVAFCDAGASEGSDKSSRRRRRAKPEQQEKPPAAATQLRRVAWDRLPGVAQPSWQEEGEPIFRAPRPDRPLVPVALLAPPLPRPPLPALPLLPRVGGDNAATRGVVLAADPALTLPAPRRTSLAFGLLLEDEEPAEGEAAGAEEPEVLGEADGETGSESGELTLVELLTLPESEIRKRREEQARVESGAMVSKDQEKAASDRVYWAGSTSFIVGTVSGERSSADRYALKLELDRLRAEENPDRTALGKLRFELRDEKGKVIRRFSGAQIDRIEFAENARNRFELARRTLPADPEGAREAQIRIAREGLAANLASEVAAWLEEVMERPEARHPDLYLLLAEAQLDRLLYPQAFATVEQAHEAAPDDVRVSVLRAEILERMGLVPQAAAAFAEASDRAVSRPAWRARARLGHGRTLLFQRRAKEALAPLRRAVDALGSEEDRGAEARFLLAEAQLDQGELAAVATEMAGWSDEMREHPRGAAIAVVRALASDDLEAARAALAPARAAYALDARLVWLDGVLTLHEARRAEGPTEKWAQARDLFLLLPELDPMRTAWARLGMAWIAEKRGQDDEAAEHVEQALVADPTDLPARFARARLALIRGGTIRPIGAEEPAGESAAAGDGLRKEIEALLPHFPRDPVLLGLAGHAAAERVVTAAGTEGADAEPRRDDEAAMRYFDQLAEADPEYPHLAGLRMIVAARAGAFDAAGRVFEKTRSRARREPFFLAADAYRLYKEGFRDEALRRFRQWPEDADVAAELDRWVRDNRARIEDNLSKRQWTDAFVTPQLRSSWTAAQGHGIVVDVDAERGMVRLAGTQRAEHYVPTLIAQQRKARAFVGFNAAVVGPVRDGVQAGIGLVVFGRRRQTPLDGDQERRSGSSVKQLQHALQLAVSPEGGLVWRLVDNRATKGWQPLDVPLPGSPDDEDRIVRLGISLEDPEKGACRFTLYGEPIGEPITFKPLGSGRGSDLELQLFVQPAPDVNLTVRFDEVTIITRSD